MEVYITTRKELYDLVWAESISSLADKLGIPFGNLLKACKDSNIPTPPVGYWQKIRHNKKVKKIELIDSHLNPTIRISKARKQSRNKSTNDRVINVPSKLVDPHPLVQQAKIELNEARPYRDGVVSTNSNSVNITVSKACIPRALRIMDALLKHLIKDGHEITVSHSTTYAIINGEKIEISLREKQKRINSRDSTFLNTTELIPTGILVFKYGEHSWCSKEVVDGKLTLEQQISNVISRLTDESRRIKENNKEIRLRRLEYEKNRKKEFEIQEKIEADNRAFQKFIDDANKHHQANILRNYLLAIKSKISHKGDEMDSNFTNRVLWFEKKIAEFDPLTNWQLIFILT